MFPDTLVGTDSHTTMINGLGVLGWGVGGIEAEAAMLGQPVSMLIPEVVGFELSGQLRDGVTATTCNGGYGPDYCYPSCEERGRCGNRCGWTHCLDDDVQLFVDLVEEVAALRLGVETFGEGKWAEIVREFADVLVDRTSMDVKDKWRNLETKRKKDDRKAADKEAGDSS